MFCPLPFIRGAVAINELKHGNSKPAGKIFGETVAEGVTAVAADGAFRGVSKGISALKEVPISNPVPSTVARVVPVMEYEPTTLGRPGDANVFVTAPKDIAGMNSTQIADALGIRKVPQDLIYLNFQLHKVYQLQ